MYELIKNAEVKFPDPVKHNISISENAQDLISLLLQKDPTLRIGEGGAGIRQIFEHPFFDEFSVEDLLEKKIEPPYMPNIKPDDFAFIKEQEMTAYNCFSFIYVDHSIKKLFIKFL